VKQKDIFLESEGNIWFQRNASALGSQLIPESDSLLQEILELPSRYPSERTKILEIGCGDGARLSWLREKRGFDCYGIEPSAQAVEVAKGRGLAAYEGTADRLPFDEGEFDIVTFGFCLYLCDREDLFRIAYEADRVLKNPGWLLILDFFSPTPLKRDYHHRSGLFSHKMDYRTLFTWNPAYINYSHKIRGHLEHAYTDDPQEWVATSVLRKNWARSE
jgi:ubiquinone/menaquinone biosynthesis C-methylase UbiE